MGSPFFLNETLIRLRLVERSEREITDQMIGCALSQQGSYTATTKREVNAERREPHGSTASSASGVVGPDSHTTGRPWADTV